MGFGEEKRNGSNIGAPRRRVEDARQDHDTALEAAQRARREAGTALSILELACASYSPTGK